MLADWDPRLISPERALELAGDWPVHFSTEFADLGQFEMEGGGPAQEGRLQINIRCGKCGQSCGLLTDIPSREMPKHGFDGPDTTIGDLLSGVLRHMVTAHDQSLSGATDG